MQNHEFQIDLLYTICSGCGLLFCVLMWLLYFWPDVPFSIFPKLSFLGGGGGAATATRQPMNLRDAVLPMPTTVEQAWSLGKLDARLTAAEMISNNVEITEILQAAKRVLGRSAPVSAADLHALNNAELLTPDSPMGRFLGMFTFVNLIWILAIAGVGVAIIPTAIHFASVLKVLELAFELFTYLHRIGALAVFLYFVCAVLCTDGVRRSASDWGWFLSLTGLILSLSTGAYTCLVHGHAHTLTEACTWFALCSAPIAVANSSVFIAFCSTAAAFSALGFGVWHDGLSYYIGFETEETMLRVSSASVVIIVATVALRIARIYRPVFAVFSTPAQVFGTTAFFSSALIMTSRYYMPHDIAHDTYVDRQVYMILMLLAAAAVGAVFNLTSMFNTACVFGTLYAIEKYAELHIDLGFHWGVLVLILSSALWAASWWLYSHPGFVAKAMFSGF